MAGRKIDKDVLIQYTDMLREIDYLSKKIEKLKNDCVKYEAQRIHDAVSASHREYPYTQYTAHVEGVEDIRRIFMDSEIKKEIGKLEKRYQCLLEITREVMEFVDSIEDSHIRMIITYRFIENLSWEKVASAMGGGNTEGSVKMAFQRFISK